MMSSNAVESRWQRFLGWINRQRQEPGESVSAGASHATEGRELPKAEQVDAWEDEGGAPAVHAAGGSAVPAPPGNPTR
jgi:hypothetical protein